MAKKYNYPTEPFIHDEGRFVVRGLAPRTYVGVRIFHDEGFRSIRGEDTERVCTQYDSIVNGEFKKRAGMRQYHRKQSDKKREKLKVRQEREESKQAVLDATLRLQFHWLAKKWV